MSKFTAPQQRTSHTSRTRKNFRWRCRITIIPCVTGIFGCGNWLRSENTDEHPATDWMDFDSGEHFRTHVECRPASARTTAAGAHAKAGRCDAKKAAGKNEQRQCDGKRARSAEMGPAAG